MEPSDPPRRPHANRRGPLVGVAIVVALVVGAVGTVGVSLAGLSPANTVLACASDSFRIPRAIACWWAKGPAGLDPNAPAIEDDTMTVFMFTLNGFGLGFGEDPHEYDAQILDLLAHWSDDVDWTLTDQVGLPPLHAAVLHNDPTLVAALLDMGAPLDVVAGDATETFAGLTAPEMVVALHELTLTSPDPPSADAVARRTEIATLLGTSLD